MQLRAGTLKPSTFQAAILLLAAGQDLLDARKVSCSLLSHRLIESVMRRRLLPLGLRVLSGASRTRTRSTPCTAARAERRARHFPPTGPANTEQQVSAALAGQEYGAIEPNPNSRDPPVGSLVVPQSTASPILTDHADLT